MPGIFVSAIEKRMHKNLYPNGEECPKLRYREDQLQELDFFKTKAFKKWVIYG